MLYDYIAAMMYFVHLCTAREMYFLSAPFVIGHYTDCICV